MLSGILQANLLACAIVSSDGESMTEMKLTTNMSRRSFLALSMLAATSGMALAADPLAGFTVFDGVMQPQNKDRVLSRSPGAVKRFSGVDLSNMTMREPSMARITKALEALPECFRLVRTKRDLKLAIQTKRHGVLYYFQKDLVIKDPAKVEEWYRKGLRTLLFAYDVEGPLGQGDRVKRGGLTPLGRKVLRRVNRLGIVPDVSHCNRRTTLDVVNRSTSPVTANHCNAYRLRAIERNKTDEEILAIASTGGCIGVTPVGWMLGRKRAHLSGFVDHLEYMVDLVGIEHVNIATDSWMDGISARKKDHACSLLSSPDRWRHLVVELRRRGYSNKSISAVLGGNLVRVYNAVLPS